MNNTHLRVVSGKALPLHTSMALSQHDLIALELQAGDRLRSDCGTLWVTVDGQPEDVMVDAGHVHTIKAAGTVNVSALRSACLVVLGRAPLQWHRVSDQVKGPVGRALDAVRDGVLSLARHLQSPPQHAAGR
ncbi:DUF2917 domain-containing protein [Aquabacterium sp.]|uniref:DUF2917 domain-containing protein n=1 Tax=Aquabacterium sp. TaxID=1872578 RepID=UPI002BD22E5C|nr:DUF2917 domain-containing protein [Aquabacterium sp.]HSW06248.1 DUF2917 domain-containing protein [Aquabacterium sp.]